MTTRRPIPEAELVLANARAELRIARRWLTSSLEAHRRVGISQLDQIIDGIAAVLDGPREGT